MWWYKLIIIIFALGMVISLMSGFAFLVKDKSEKTRTLTALKWRVFFAIGLIALLVVGYYFGWIGSHPSTASALNYTTQ